MASDSKATPMVTGVRDQFVEGPGDEAGDLEAIGSGGGGGSGSLEAS